MFGIVFGITTDLSGGEFKDNANTKSLKETTFSLPINYLDKADIHALPDVVATDLELSIPGSDDSMYKHLFLPKNDFAKNMIPEWRKSYTTNTGSREHGALWAHL